MDLDKKLPPDLMSVLNAAAMLDVTEYEVFQLAWWRWHGQRSDPEAIEPHFVAYMFRGVVPPWVRYFSRSVEEHFERGDLDRGAFGVVRLRESRQMASRGMRYTVIVMALVVFVVWLAQVAAKFSQLLDRCLFPPCY